MVSGDTGQLFRTARFEDIVQEGSVIKGQEDGRMVFSSILLRHENMLKSGVLYE
jgi:hypothetical protein